MVLVLSVHDNHEGNLHEDSIHRQRLELLSGGHVTEDFTLLVAFLDFVAEDSFWVSFEQITAYCKTSHVDGERPLRSPHRVEADNFVSIDDWLFEIHCT
jgi:hypothetical protein